MTYGAGEAAEDDRASRLDALAGALLGARTPLEVARVALDTALPLLEGGYGVFYVPDEAGTSHVMLHQVGLPEADVRRYRVRPAGPESLLSRAQAQGKPLWYVTPEALLRDAPYVAGSIGQGPWYPLALVPLQVGDERLGVVLLSFGAAGALDRGRAFIASVARQIGVAFQRAQLLEADRRVREQAQFLSAATAELGASLDHAATLEAVLRVAVPALCDGCSVDLLGADGRLHDVARKAPEGERGRISEELRLRYPSHVAVSVLEAIAADGSIFLPEIPPGFHERNAADAEYVRLVAAMDLRSMVIVPLRSRGRVYGSINFCRFAGRPPFEARDRPLVEEFARRCGLALDNARLYEQAQAAARMREEFLSIAAHELKTPLHALGMNLDLLLARADGAGSPEVMERLRAVRRQAHRMGALVEELLRLSRLANGRLALERSTFDLAGLAREVARSLGEGGGRAPVRVEAREPVVGSWDRDRLGQVLANLIENGLKYGEGRPVEVRVRARADGAVEVEVSDSGIGLEPQALGRIFDRFERAVSERHYGGFGLGLWIARELVEAHGGAITAESEPGRGATFRVRLPREAP